MSLVRYFPQYEEIEMERQKIVRKMDAIRSTMGTDNECFVLLRSVERSLCGQLDYLDENPDHYN